MNSTPIIAKTDSGQEPVCCFGCKAVTEHIYQAGLGSYYQFRTEVAAKPNDRNSTSDYDIYNDPHLVDLISSSKNKSSNPTNSDQRSIILSVDNIHCAACSWLIDLSLSKLQGINSVNVNTINQRVEISWDKTQLSLPDILARLDSVGYPAAPLQITVQEVRLKNQEKQYIKRLGVAGLFTMQIMMLAFSMYFGVFNSMETHQTIYFKWLSMGLSLPVVFYSAFPFLSGAITALKLKRLSMDVPVSCAIFGAFFASLYQLILNGFANDNGEVFFESICMFTFLLLIGKYLEFKAKSKAVLANANLHNPLTLSVTKLVNNEEHKTLVKDLQINDVVLIKAGEKIVIDGFIIDGNTSVNESVLNGEFEPIRKKTNDMVYAGSVNNDGIIKVNVTAFGEDTTLSYIGQLQQQFSIVKPKFTRIADSIAHWFVLGQLLVALITYVIWFFYQPEDALWVSLSVLVATCPCALSLATPTAYTCIFSALNKIGILIKDGLAFDRLTGITDVIFDKTGTLTKGEFTIQHISESDNIRMSDKLAIYHLQSQSEHPISRAFTAEALKLDQGQLHQVSISNVEISIGEGIQCEYNGQLLKIGKHGYALNGDIHPDKLLVEHNVVATLDGEFIASFMVTDQIKPEAKSVIANLISKGINVHMLSGDSSTQVEKTAHELEITEYRKACSPKDKADYITELQKGQAKVIMVGDGINDTPVFSAADVSVAMGQGSDIAKHVSDIVILRGDLNAIIQLLASSKQTRKVISHNLIWSLVYNAIILPIAMMGWVAPYIAVIGMSASSILVVSHSLSLLKFHQTELTRKTQ